MLVFPQLGTGASALYPLTRHSIQRSAVNTLGDGSTVVYADTNGAATAWELQASGLTTAERNAIETLFQATSGMWQTFTFLDPTANLLLQSEDFGAPVWSNGALIQLTTGIEDALGTTRATRAVNAAQTAEGVAQTLSVPGNFQYSLSVWARSLSGSNVTLSQATAGASANKQFPLTTEWARIFFSTNLGQSTASVTFSAQLDAGATVDLFGMQVDAQPAPSEYQETGAAGGVRSQARFAEDRLTMVAEGTDINDAVIRIVDTEG